MAPLNNPFKREPRYPLDKPATPELVEKIDRLNALFQEAMLLRKEIEQDWIRLSKEDQARFIRISSQAQLRKIEGKTPTARPSGPTQAPKKPRRSLLEQIEEFDFEEK